jgi:lipoate-protein ligase A
MAVVHTVVQPTVAPRASIACDRALVAQMPRRGAPVLRVYGWPGDLLLLGRYHASPGGCADAPRRLSGGRAVVAGTGFVGISLVLPHRSALVSDDPQALSAEQVLNRAVRGILGGLEVLGIAAYYPGRDLVTVGGKPIGWLSLAVEEGGVTVVEAGLAIERDLALLPMLADRLDPGGVVPVTLWLPDAVTSLARERRGPVPGVADIAGAVSEGFRRRLGCEIVPDAPSREDEVYAVDVAGEGVPDGAGAGRTVVMLGTLLATVLLAPDGTLAAVRFGGDVIAPVATVRAIERALIGEIPARAALVARVVEVLARRDHFLLGVTADDIAAAVLSGVAG